MKQLKIYFSLITVLVLSYACENVEQPVEEEQIPDAEAAFRASTAVVGIEDVTLSKWEANKDKIGVFASNEGGILCENRYFYAFSSTAASKFKSPRDEQHRMWETDAAADVYAYYPFRTSNTDPEAIPCSLPSEQPLAPDVIPDIKDIVLYDARQDVSYADGLPELCLKPSAALLKVCMKLDKPVTINSIAVSSSSSEPIAFQKGTLDLSDGTVTVIEGGQII